MVTVLSSPGKLQRIAKRLKSEEKELKETITFMPSQLSPQRKKTLKYETQEKMGEIKEKRKKTEEKAKAIEKKRKEIARKLGKLARKKVVSKRILKKSKASLHIAQKEYPSILGSPNEFFSGEVEDAEMQMFFR